MVRQSELIVPADVPLHVENDFRDNYQLILQDRKQICIVAITHIVLDTQTQGLVKLEDIIHYVIENNISTICVSPALMVHYAQRYQNICYIATLDFKRQNASQETSLAHLLTIDQLVTLKEESDIPIAGVKIILDIGSRYEDLYITHVAQSIYQAHQHGLVTFLQVMYRRLPNEQYNQNTMIELIETAANVGADFLCLPFFFDHEHDINYRLISTSFGSVKIVGVLTGKTWFKTKSEIIQNVLDDNKIAGLLLDIMELSSLQEVATAVQLFSKLML